MFYVCPLSNYANTIRTMSIVLIFLGCFLLYAKSKHFPVHFLNVVAKFSMHKIALRSIAYLLFFFATILLMIQYGPATGLVIFLIALMFGLCLTIMFLPLNKKYAYLLVGLSLVCIIIENTL